MRGADLIREARLRAGLTQAELAARMGKAASVIGRWEQGRSKPSFETVMEAVRAAGYEPTIWIPERDDHDRTLILNCLALEPAERLAGMVAATRAFAAMAAAARG